MVMATRGVTIRDYAIFMLKLWLDGLKDVALIGLTTGAVVLDVISGKGRRPRLFYTVVRAGERFDRWLNLHGAAERLEAGGDSEDDGLFGVSEAGSDSLLGKLEQAIRGGDEPRGKRAPRDHRVDPGDRFE